jgi:hypothetical protein
MVLSMSIEQQNARITEVPSEGWVIWLSPDAMAMVEALLHSVADDPEESMEDRKLANDVLEGIY